MATVLDSRCCHPRHPGAAHAGESGRTSCTEPLRQQQATQLSEPHTTLEYCSTNFKGGAPTCKLTSKHPGCQCTRTRCSCCYPAARAGCAELPSRLVTQGSATAANTRLVTAAVARMSPSACLAEGAIISLRCTVATDAECRPHLA